MENEGSIQNQDFETVLELSKNPDLRTSLYSLDRYEDDLVTILEFHLVWYDN